MITNLREIVKALHISLSKRLISESANSAAKAGDISGFGCLIGIMLVW